MSSAHEVLACGKIFPTPYRTKQDFSIDYRADGILGVAFDGGGRASACG